MLKPRDSRKFDIVLFGATGFTGKEVAEYLALYGPQGMRWSLAGRSLAKLETLKKRLVDISPNSSNIDVVTADVNDKSSLHDIVRDAKVVITTVGPYTKYGTPVVEACVQNKTDYVDITGETPWIKKIIEQFHMTAESCGTILVPSCGFDSVPSDIGTLMVVDFIKQKWDRDTGEVKGTVKWLKGGISGGTIQSTFAVLEQPWSAIEMFTDPYFLSPVTGQQGFSLPLCYDSDFGKWQGPHFLAASNERLVQRSYGLKSIAGHSYGKFFSYREYFSYRNIITALLATISWSFVSMALFIPPLRWILQKYALQPGSGPTKEQIEKGGFECQFIGEACIEPYEKPLKAMAKVKGFKDPGYGETAKMVSECALALVYDRQRIPGKGGIMTPSTAFGHVLVERLNAAGMELSVEALTKSKDD
ncbi:9646_t:CDS:2 [Paraglomus brasilianum]|uniref:9646_t:CDS:1 n=1 Tax=Paraglomus brasilianum TaxID=144538 RepID=A0A9N9CRL8_9GLOM|nr:9646_t:CDS:2 [Paraglomus brasilianum]